MCGSLRMYYQLMKEDKNQELEEVNDSSEL